MAMIQTFPTGSGSGSGGSITILGCFNTAPATFVQGDIYYNTTDDLIYTANSSTTWDAGSAPQIGGVYISIADQTIYSYDVTNGWRPYGGGSGVSVSSKSDNALQNVTGSATPSENGLYVEDLKPLINSINLAQKTTVKVGSEPIAKAPLSCDLTPASTAGTSVITAINQEMLMIRDITDYDYIRIEYTPVTPDRKRHPQFTDIKVSEIVYNPSNTEVINDGSIIALFYSVDSTLDTVGGSCQFAIKCWFKNKKTLFISVINDPFAGNSWKNVTITNVYGIRNEQIVIDPVNYVDSTKGIEDTPVGEVIRTLGDGTPKHYLFCDGSEYNIVDYPHLAQYFKDTFGAINVFGGDGITTFAVPDYAIEKKLNTSSIASNAWASSIYNSNYAASKAFNGTVNVNTNYWQTAEPVTFPVEIGIDLGSEYYITRYALHNYGWNTASINDRPNTWDFEGSNDKINWNTIDTVTNYIWTSDTPEFKVSIPGSYRYYRLIIKTCVGTGVSGVSIAPILNQILLYYANSNFTHIKAEPTYYMELNQAAYINQYCDTYDTNEIVIGKDFNGKPIYRKVVELNKSYADGTDTLIATIANADTFIRIDAYLIWSDGSKQMVCSSGADDVSLYLTSNNELRFYNHTKYAINCKYAILEYTKSTDADNSFDYGMIIDQFAQEALLDVAVTDAEVNRCFE